MTDDTLRQECKQLIDAIPADCDNDYDDRVMALLLAFARQQQAKAYRDVIEETMNLKYYHFENSIQAIQNYCEAQATAQEKHA